MRTSRGNVVVLISVFLFNVSAQRFAKECGPPREHPSVHPEAGYRSQMSYPHRSQIRYQCALGYMAVGGSLSIECLNGRWSALTLQCARKPCGSAGDILNGYFEYEGNALFGDRAFAMCNEGYRLKGDRWIQCGNNGWEGKVPTCEQSTAEITCPSPAVENALRTGGDALEFRAGDALSFACQPGYDLHGSQKITCGPDGKWVPELPVCLPTRTAVCSAPEDYNNTTRLEDEYQTRTEFFSGDEVRYTCAAGYVQESGSPSIVCQNGQWTRLTLMCQRYVPGGCGAPIPYPNMELVEGYLTQQDFPEESRVRYRCTMGHIRSGGTTSFSYCKNGVWTRVGMECERKSCGSAGEILYGRYKYEGNLFGDKAFAVCDKGYQLVGLNYRQCLNMGWDGRDPVCEAVKCADPPEVVDGVWTGPMDGPFKYGTVITYYCHRGQLLGKSEIYCTFNGTWSSAAPQCKEITCPNLVIANAEKISGFGTRYRYKSAISFRCKKGYVLQGNRTVVCEQNGKWTKRPKCTTIKCPSLSIENGKPSSGRRLYQQVVDIRCDKGFKLNGAKQLKCSANATWLPEGCTLGTPCRETFPKCEKRR